MPVALTGYYGDASSGTVKQCSATRTLKEADILPGQSATNHKNLILSINPEIIINLVFQKV